MTIILMLGVEVTKIPLREREREREKTLSVPTEVTRIVRLGGVAPTHLTRGVGRVGRRRRESAAVGVRGYSERGTRG